ncbi:hypothetical protein [Aquimonas sp.]|jgi:hypothetical protein|uniref:hypothetical protein n=1 Tax=Aquimonas sp. TaxID=1872588 RepID=UPI0037BF700F
MSQDSHRLHLQFTSAAPQRLFERWLAAYVEGDGEAQQRWGRMLGLQSDTLTADAWFNVESAFDGMGCVVNYDTRTSDDPPLRLLQGLYARGLLGGVVLSTFHGQVGERSALLFDAGQQVGSPQLRARRPELGHLIDALEQNLDEGDDAPSARGPDTPRPISALIAEQDKQRREAEAAVDAVRDLVKAARASGSSPLELLQAVSLVGRLLRMAAWGLGSLVVGGLLLAYTPLRWWALPLLLWALLSYRFYWRELGKDRWTRANWSYHLFVWLTPVVLVGGFLALEPVALQWAYASVSGLLAGLMLWTLGDALFGASDSDALSEPASLDAVAADEAPPARWMEVLGTVVLSLPSFIAALLGVLWSLRLPVVQGWLG